MDIIKIIKSGRAKELNNSDELRERDLIYYTGKNQNAILKNYRLSLSEAQKDQRLRISVNRTKSLLGTVESILNQLHLMDKPTVKALVSENESAENILTSFIYDYSLTDYAFNIVKYANLVDANSFIVSRLGDNQDLEFDIIPCNNVYFVDEFNGIIKSVIFKFVYENKEVYEYFSKDEYIKISKLSDSENYVQEDRKAVNKMLAMRLGYQLSLENNFKTCVTIIDKASELIKGYMWKSSDLDVDMATHGIIEKRRYVQTCNYSSQGLDGSRSVCQSGRIFNNSSDTGEKCPQCKGKGIKEISSSQDVLNYPINEKTDFTTLPKLADLSHVTTIDTSTFEFNERHLFNLKNQILESIFTASSVTSSEIAKTAFEKSVDLQGLYSTLNQLGAKVSEVFIWMVECKAYFNSMDLNKVNIIHGYTMSLKLQTIESLALLRKTLLDAQAPVEMIKSIDLAILSKQNIDSPLYVARYAIWEKYKPFNDKAEDAISLILSELPATNLYKIKYNFWAEIKNAILDQNGDLFYSLSPDKKKSLIDLEAQRISDLIKESTPELTDTPIF